MTKLTIESVGSTREDAIAHALRVLAGLVRSSASDYDVGDIDGSASAKVEEIDQRCSACGENPGPDGDCKCGLLGAVGNEVKL